MNDTEIKTCWLCGADSHENSLCPLSVEQLTKNAKNEVSEWTNKTI